MLDSGLRVIGVWERYAADSSELVCLWPRWIS